MATKTDRRSVVVGAFRYGCSIETIARVLNLKRVDVEQLLREGLGGKEEP